jgi:hypothetical protein
MATTSSRAALTPVRSHSPARRRPLFQHPWRIAIVVAAVLVVANLGLLLLDAADTEPVRHRGLPTAVEGVTPGPGELIRLQDTIVVDLRDNLTGVLLLDGAEVPEDQLDRVVPLGQLSFRPGPSKDLLQFEPGEHTAVVLYWPQGKARPATPASYSWRFRAGA